MYGGMQVPPLIPRAVPQPQCNELRNMASPPRWEQCASDANLASFAMYLACYASDDEVQELVQLPVVYHCCAPGELFLSPPIGGIIDGEFRQLPQVPCIDGQCEQCGCNLGGYTFFWVDPRWTPEAALLDQCDVECMGEQLAMPWPRGVLQVPRPIWCSDMIAAVDDISAQWESFFDQTDSQVPLLLLHAPGFLSSSSRPFDIPNAGNTATAVGADPAVAELTDEARAHGFELPADEYI